MKLCSLTPFIVEPKMLENTNNVPKCESDSKKSVKLKKLVKEMQEMLLINNKAYSISEKRFSWLNKGKYNPFGYDIRKGEKLKINLPIYKRNRLRNKLIRIQNEFKFVDRNINNYLKLTSREKEIIQLLVKGYNSLKIAEILFISRSTVEQHRKHINCKLKVKSFAQLMRYAYAFDLV